MCHMRRHSAAGNCAQGPDAQYRYMGGEVFNESLPLSFTYMDVVKRLNDKLSDTVSFRYLSPGDDLNPDALIQVMDNDDLQVGGPGILLVHLMISFQSAGRRCWPGLEVRSCPPAQHVLRGPLDCCSPSSSFPALHCTAQYDDPVQTGKCVRMVQSSHGFALSCLQEMYEEYTEALQRASAAGKGGKTFRIMVYVFRAVQFECNVQLDQQQQDDGLFEDMSVGSRFVCARTFGP